MSGLEHFCLRGDYGSWWFPWLLVAVCCAQWFIYLVPDAPGQVSSKLPLVLAVLYTGLVAVALAALLALHEVCTAALGGRL